MKEASGGEEQIEITWRPFSLEQVNQKVGPDFEAWAQDDADMHPSVWGLRAGEAARRQGDDAMRRFLPLLLRARHEDRVELGDKEMLKGLAAEAGLDVDRFAKDLEDRELLNVIAESHRHATQDLGVFGTPTFVFENGAASFLKLIRPKSPESALQAFNSLMDLMENESFVGEVKRPQPPWPKGVFD